MSGHLSGHRNDSLLLDTATIITNSPKALFSFDVTSNPDPRCLNQIISQTPVSSFVNRTAAALFATLTDTRT